MLPDNITTEEWLQKRIGKVTASRIADLTATLSPPGKYLVEPRAGGKFAVIREGASKATKVMDNKPAAEKYAAECSKPAYGASRGNYMAELIVERLTGEQADGYINAAMQHGIDTEPEAIAHFSFSEGLTVEPSDFFDHPRIEMAGASPDGLIDDDGLLEVKCPMTSTHIETLLSGKISLGYMKQIQWQLACTERKYCWWVSYDPRMPGELCMYRQRVERDEKMIAALEDEVLAFMGELGEKIAQLEKIGQG